MKKKDLLKELENVSDDTDICLRHSFACLNSIRVVEVVDVLPRISCPPHFTRVPTSLFLDRDTDSAGVHLDVEPFPVVLLE